MTLRSPRAFVLQLLYVCVLGALVYFYWPAGEEGARQVSPGVARRLFDIFFLGQFFLVALMAPTFAAGSITGEKERKTYELLLASPLRPGDDPGGQAAELAQLPGDPDRLQPAADDPLLPAGRAAALGDHAQLPGADPGGGDVRAAERRLLELSSAAPARRWSSATWSSCRWRSLCVVLTRTDNVDGARLRLDRRPAALVPGDLDRAGHPGQSAACSTRPTSAARARTSSTRKRR